MNADGLKVSKSLIGCLKDYVPLNAQSGSSLLSVNPTISLDCHWPGDNKLRNFSCFYCSRKMTHLSTLTH